MSAAQRAESEAAAWADIARICGEIGPGEVTPGAGEAEVLGHDPGVDLERRASHWGFEFVDHGLAQLCRFGAGLAMAESNAWSADDPTVATRAFSDRRFLLADRIAPWAIPWADEAGCSHPELREPCHIVRDLLIEFSDEMRIAPLLTGDEGLSPPGEDTYGVFPPPLPETLASLASGTVIFAATIRSMGGSGRVIRPTPAMLDEVSLEDLVVLFENAAGRWIALSRAHEGSARLWRDLGRRAHHTAEWLPSVAVSRTQGSQRE